MPRKQFDPNLHIDASSSYGLGFVIENKYAGWQLIAGWACDGRDIGWAESVALELAIYWLIQEGYQGMNITILSDNTGVIGAFSSGRSHNPARNPTIRHTTVAMIPTNISISPEYLTSSGNLADAVSRGATSGYNSRLNCAFPLPTDLAPWLTPI